MRTRDDIVSAPSFYRVPVALGMCTACRPGNTIDVPWRSVLKVCGTLGRRPLLPSSLLSWYEPWVMFCFCAVTHGGVGHCSVRRSDGDLDGKKRSLHLSYSKF